MHCPLLQHKYKIAGAFEDQLMRIVLGMNNRLVTIHEDVKKLNKHVWGGPREQTQRQSSIRTQIPCDTFQQLQNVDEELALNDGAMAELVLNSAV